MTKSYTYQVLVSRQLDEGKELALFVAPVTEIVSWCGIPQKKIFGANIESAGFQRVENPKRLDEIADFLKNPANTLQNPLLCAERITDLCKVQFTASSSADSSAKVKLGTLTIEFPDFDNMPYADVLQHVIQYLECRLPYLKTLEIPKDLIYELYIELKNSPLPLNWIDVSAFEDNADGGNDFVHTGTDEDGALEEVDNDTDSEEESSTALFGESHMEKFWTELVARREILSKLTGYAEDSFLGFTKDALLS